MTIRHAVLPVAGALVLGMGVYLLVEVRRQTSPAAGEVVAPAHEVSQASAARPTAPSPAVAAHEAAARKPQPEAPRPPVFRDAATPAPGGPGAGPGGTASDDADLVGPKLDAAMAEANQAYDRGDYEEAKQLAGRVLARYPSSVRMLRIMVSASCIDGDSAVALPSYAKLPAPDQQQMRVRCARYGFSFPDQPEKQ